jgi:hypothetical protein
MSWEDDLDQAPQAAAVRVFFCLNPDCHRPHVVLLDAQDRPFAQFVVPDYSADGTGFINDLQRACYSSAAMRDR